MQHSISSSLEKSARVRLITWIIGVGAVLSILFHAYMHYVLHWGFPWNTVLCCYGDDFGDLLNAEPVVRKLGSSTIFPTLNLVLWLVFRMSGFTAVIVTLSVFTVFFFLFNSLHIWDPKRSIFPNIVSVLVIPFLGYPYIFELQRANLECVVFIFLALFVVFFERKRYFLSSLFLACAIGMKIFPAVFVILYLKKRRYRELLWVGGILAVLASTLALAPNFQATLDQAKYFFSLYTNDYVIGDSGLRYGHSLYGLLKTIFYLVPASVLGAAPEVLLREHSTMILRSYTLMTFMVYGGVALFIYRSKELAYWREVTILVLCCLILPNVSADYRLLHLYTPLALFLCAPTDSARMRVFAWLFGLALVPKAYYHIAEGLRGSFSTIVQPLLLITFLYLLLSDRPTKLHTRES